MSACRRDTRLPDQRICLCIRIIQSSTAPRRAFADDRAGRNNILLLRAAIYRRFASGLRIYSPAHDHPAVHRFKPSYD